MAQDGRRYGKRGYNRKFVHETQAHPAGYETGDPFEEEGAFRTVRFQSDDGFVIGTFTPKHGEEIVCKGNVPGFVLGAPYKVKGRVVNDKKWGLQVNIESAVSVKPSTSDEIVAFLGSGAIRGIGPALAKRIYAKFGKDTIHVLEQTPERLREVSGIGEKMMPRLMRDIPLQLRYREIIGFFANFGISTTTINSLIRVYGDRARDVVENNPYVLCKVRGFAFSRADSIAMKMGVDRHDPNRLYAGVLATLRWMCENGGHTLIPRDQLLEEAMRKLSANDAGEVSDALDRLIGSEDVVADDKGIHLKHLYKAEEEIKKAVRASARKKDPLIDRDDIDAMIERNELKAGFSLTDEQRKAVYNAAERKLSILAGTPGGGKAQPLHSKVLTAYGWKAMGDISVGDLVYTPKGTLAHVTGVFDRGVREVWSVYLEDGRRVECCDEHLWDVKGALEAIVPDAARGEIDHHDGWKTLEIAHVAAAFADPSRIDGAVRIPATAPMEWIVSATDGKPERECDGASDDAAADGCVTTGSFDRITEDKIRGYAVGAADAGRRFAEEIANAVSAVQTPHETRSSFDGKYIREAKGDVLNAATALRTSLPRIDKRMLRSHIEQRTAFIDSLMSSIGFLADGGGEASFTDCARRFSWTLALPKSSSSFADPEEISASSRKWSEAPRASGGAPECSVPDRMERGMPIVPTRGGLECAVADDAWLSDGKRSSISGFVSDLAELSRGLGLSFRVLRPIGGNGEAPLAVVEVSSAPADGAVGIASIEKTGCAAPMRCIMIDDPDHLYVTDGYAATHNTTACRIVSDVMRDAGLSVCLISPTGRAAKRLSESCGLPGYTMHRALSIQVRQSADDDFFAEDETTTFTPRNQSSAAEAFKRADVVLADEASMMDTEMASILFRACKKKHLVLIGDPNQLPAVGCGRVLGDLIECSFSQGEDGMLTTLTKVFRQAEGSPIIEAANLVQQGKSPCYVKGVRFFECENDQVDKVMVDKVVPLIKKERLTYSDYMIISPIKKTPHSGVNALNDVLRPLLNPHYRKPRDERLDWKLQKGDFVSQKKNNYEVDIFNGDIGIVDSVDAEGNVRIDFADSDEIVEFEPHEVSENLMMAYASTVHRQQGSQARLVVVVCTTSQFALLNRNLLYTAITRASDELVLVGDKKAFAMAARNKKENTRMTGLSDL